MLGLAYGTGECARPCLRGEGAVVGLAYGGRVLALVYEPWCWALLTGEGALLSLRREGTSPCLRGRGGG